MRRVVPLSVVVFASLFLVAASDARASSCSGDLDFSGAVDGADLTLLINSWGTAECDITGDQVVDGADLGALMSSWGPCPQAEEWSLVTALGGTTTIALDAGGNTVKTWTGAANGASVGYLRPDGSLVRPCVYASGALIAGGRGGRIQIFNPAGVLTNDLIVATATTQQHHDIRPMPNGNILCLVWDQRTVAEQTAAGRQSVNGLLWSEQILEIRPTGMSTYEVVWQWKAWDHLIQDVAPTAANFGVVADHPELLDVNFSTATTPVDWIHLNSIDYNPVRDEIVISSRSWSEVWVIDHSTTSAQAASHSGGARGRGGDILYRWGNPLAYRRGGSAERDLFVCHSATWVPVGLPGAHDILIFNNGDRPGAANDWSQVVQVAPARSASGDYLVPVSGEFSPPSPSWSHGSPGGFYGGATQCGAFRTLDNTTLIMLTNSGTLFEVNAAGATVATRTLSGNVARVPRYRLVGGVWVGP
jgi:hypothetical protein